MDQQNLSLLHELIEGTSEGLWTWNLATNQAYLNAQANHLLDLPQDKQRDPFEAILYRLPDKERKETIIAMQALQQEGSPYQQEHRIPLSDGTLRYCLCRGQVTEWNAQGKPAKLSGSITDITHLKQVEDALTSNQHRLNRVITGSNDGIWDWNMKTNELYWNQRFYEILGLDPNTVKPNFDLLLTHLSPAERQKMLAAIDAHLERQAPYQVEYHLQQPDGSIRTCMCRGKVTERDSDGQPVWFSGTLSDISHLKNVEASLQTAQEMLDRVISGTEEGYWEWDALSDQMFCSARFFEMLGISPLSPQAGYKDYQAKIVEEDKQRVINAWDRSMSLGVPFQEEFRMRHSSGKVIDFHSRGKPAYDDQGRLIRISGMIADVTQRKNVEKSLEAANRQLDQSNKDLALFASFASHDLKAPLRKIGIFSHTLEKDADKLSAEAQDALTRIQNSIHSMQVLIDELLSWSQLQHLSMDIQPVDLESVIRQAMHVLKPMIEETHAEIHLGPLQPVLADESQLVQLFQNLIENGLKYQPPGQQPMLSIESQRLSETEVKIWVRDNGIGFPPDQSPKIFEPFSRLHGKFSPYPGSGMGLAICKRVVERHGGTITADSEPDHGSTFIVTLPAAIEAALLSATAERAETQK